MVVEGERVYGEDPAVALGVAVDQAKEVSSVLVTVCLHGDGCS